MRIAFYAPLKSPTHDTPSGDRRVGRLLMDALRIAGHAVELASDFRSLDRTGDPAHQVALRDEGGALAKTMWARWQALPSTQRPEMWFTYHLYYKAPDWLGPELSAALDIPYVAAEASFASKRADGPWALGHAAARAAIEKASLLLCPTQDDMAGVRIVAAAHTPVVLLPPFLDPAPYRAAALMRNAHRAQLAAAHSLDAARPWIVVAAMMRHGDKRASYAQLAQVLRRLADLPWQLLVAGDGPAREEVRALLQDAAPARVCFLGECQADAMAALYAASDLCLWPAVNEAYGMAMLEAQAAGVPVVSCAVRGVADVVCDGQTGLLAPADDDAGLAQRARDLLLDPARRIAMGQAALRFVSAQRSTAVAAQRLNQAFDGLRRRHAPQPLPSASA
ncbi:MAG: glycosyltransferase family 4 protein [Burkholderiaceae bacterium]